jgi:serine/threonine-protein kinase
VPFDAENFVGILSQQLYQDPVPPRQAAPHAGIPAEFEAVILKCMAKKAERRYQSMSHLREDLLALQARLPSGDVRAHNLDGADVSASVEGTALSTELSLASLRPRRWPMYAAIAAPLAIVVGVFVAQLDGSVGPTRAAQPAAQVARAPATAIAVEPPPAPASEVHVAPEPPAASPVQVLLGVAPTSAHVFLNGRDLGQSPVSIEVTPGSLVSVEVRHPKYVTRELQLDGSDLRVSIELEPKGKKKKGARASRGGKLLSPLAPEWAPEPSQPRRSTPAEDKSIGGQLFVEPWQKP